jgi:multidrug efflux pump subunit AcrA (membrane-fusion protein)
MSASASSAATPAPAPERVPAKAPQPTGFRYKGVLLLLLLALIAAGAWLLRPKKVQQTGAATVVRTYKVAPVSFERTIRAAGSTSARNFANIVAPMMRGPDSGRALVLISLAKSGAKVKKGDLLAEIDPQGIKDHADDIHALFLQADGDVRKRRADQAIEKDTLRQTLTQAKAALDKAVLDAKTKPIRMPIDQELLKLTVDEAEAEYKELQQEIKLQEQKHAAEIRILELTRDRHMRHRDRHRVDVERFKLFAPMNGLVVMQSIWRGGDMGQVQVGDQLSPGQPFMKIVDTSSMQLEAMVNQVESEEIRIGQAADVHFDAFPDMDMPGRVYSIGALAVSGWRQNYFIRTVPVNIAIKSSDPRLIPDLSASANISMETRSEALAVPQEAIFREGGRPAVFVKTGDTFHEREVKLGSKNNTQIVVLAGLSAGEEIALQRPSPAKP